MRRNWPKINYLDKSTGILTDSAIAVAVADLAVFRNPFHSRDSPQVILCYI